MHDLFCHDSFLLSDVLNSDASPGTLLQSSKPDCAPYLAQILRSKDATSGRRTFYRREPAVSLLAAPLRMPSTSSSRMMMKSSPSSLISVPEYLPNRMRSPSLTSSGRTFPSSLILPL